MLAAQILKAAVGGKPQLYGHNVFRQVADAVNSAGQGAHRGWLETGLNIGLNLHIGYGLARTAQNPALLKVQRTQADFGVREARLPTAQSAATGAAAPI